MPDHRPTPARVTPAQPWRVPWIALALLALVVTTAFGQADTADDGHAEVQTDAQTDSENAAGSGDEVVEGDEAVESAITLPADIEADVITDHLRAGEFDEALEVVETQLDRADGQLSLRLYQQGMARLGIAEQSGEAHDYKTAGISFMRVLVYFPRSRYGGFAELELGHVHHRIGRHDLASRLYDRARPSIDPERDPTYHERLMNLLDDLP